MKKLLPCLLAALLLTTAAASEAQATCSFICEGSLIDSACNSLLPAPGEDAALWTDATRAPLVAVSCQVQCCAPGMCSDPTPETIMAADLQLLDVKGGSFQEERSPLCMGKQVFSITSTLAQNEVYDVVHQGLILARFEYAPMVIEQDMGPDMDQQDMGAVDEDMGSDTQDMSSSEDMPVDAVDMASSGAQDMGSLEEPDQGDGDTNGDQEEGCQTASSGTPSGSTPLVMLGIGLLVGVRRRLWRANQDRGIEVQRSDNQGTSAKM